MVYDTLSPGEDRNLIFGGLVAAFVGFLLGLWLLPAHGGAHDAPPVWQNGPPPPNVMVLEEGVFKEFRMNGTESALFFGSPSNTIIVQPAEGHFADVKVSNRHACCQPHAFTVDLVVEGETITIYWNHGSGHTPDTVEIIPPEGYIAVPPLRDMEEGEDFTFEIWEALIG